MQGAPRLSFKMWGSVTQQACDEFHFVDRNEQRYMSDAPNCVIGSMNERGQEVVRRAVFISTSKQSEDSSLLKHLNMTCFRLVFLVYYACFQETMLTV